MKTPVLPDAGQQDLMLPLCTMLDAALASTGPSRLYVLPSTRQTIESIPRWLEAATKPVVVAPSVSGTSAPTQLLARIQSEKRPIVAIVFSDQLTSAANSPMLVELNGTRMYLSSLEIVAHCNYQFELNVWAGGDFEITRPGSDSVDILSLLCRHLSACHELGAQWLMRDLQSERQPDARISHARLRLRTFHSALMHAFADAPLPPRYRALVSQIQAMQKSLRLQASA